MTTHDDALRRALELYAAGDLAAAEAACCEILTIDPSHFLAWQYRGAVFFRTGRLQQALECFTRTLEINPADASCHNNVGLIFHELNCFDQAAAHYQNALALRPGFAEAHYNLGNTLRLLRRFVEAAASYRQALALQPDYVEACNNLGITLRELGELPQALAVHQHAVRLRPGGAELHNSLGTALLDLGRVDEAQACFARALELRPGYGEALCNLAGAALSQGHLAEAEEWTRQALMHNQASAEAYNQLGLVQKARGDWAAAAVSFGQVAALSDTAEGHNNLGVALAEQQRFAQAVACYQQALARRPDYAEAQSNLASALGRLGRLDEAVSLYRQALGLNPAVPQTHNNLGVALAELGDLEAAVACYREALRLKPDYANALINLANALSTLGHPEQAEAFCRQALAIDPKLAQGYNSLGAVLTELGCVDEALDCFRQALRLKPDLAKAHSNLLLTTHYSLACTNAEIYCEHLHWARQHASPWDSASARPPRPTIEGRRIRVGYVSADFREHPVARLVDGLLTHIDRQQFEVICYSDVTRPDEVTRRFQRQADGWCSLAGYDDATAAEMIRQQGVDILVDLAGHTACNRMLLFARRPAPVQISHFGYPNTTGLASIDFRITDAWADPPGISESFYTERLLRLPQTAWCYVPSHAPDVSELRALDRGHVVFASYNNLAKLNARVLELWVQLLNSVPKSRLRLLAYQGGSALERIRAACASYGVDPERIEGAGRRSRLQYLELYQDVDIALDPFPYNGAVTTCDALWMGVPVVTLAGDSYVSRQGLGILSNLGLFEFIAATTDDYLQIARHWATELDRLAQLRWEMRRRMRSSPLLDAAQYVRHLETAYQQALQENR